MYIGKIDNFKLKITQINSNNEWDLSADNEYIFNVKWDDIKVAGADVHVTLSKSTYINNIVMYIGEESAPTSVSVYTENKEKLLYTYTAETGKSITEKEIALSIEQEISEFIIEIKAYLSDIVIKNLEIYGAHFEGERLFPTPAQYTKKDSAVKACDISTVSAQNDSALQILKEKFEETTGIFLKDSSDGDIKLIYDDSIAKNGYHLNVSTDGIEIKASDLKGLVQGIETLIKLINNSEIECCEINDAPFCDFRGVHLMLPAEDQIDFTKRLIKYILSPMGYNSIILELAGAMEYESHPEINEYFNLAREKAKAGEWPTLPHSGVGGGKVVSKKSIRDLVSYARSFGIEIIPEIQSLGHVQFMTLAHPEIAEVSPDFKYDDNDERNADTPPNDFYAHSFCPSNPRSYEILFDLMQEIIETFEPKEYVHMGHDEVYQLGICPKCKERKPSELFAEDINKLHDFLAKKGLKMMIWGDMLQSISKYKIGKYKCYEAMDRIPKDIVLLDFIWYFFPDKDIEDTLLPHGFNVAYGNMYSSHFPRYETRIRKKGIIGAQTSIWGATNEYILSKLGKFYDILFSSQMMWSENYSQYNRFSFDKVICDIIPTLREKIKCVKYPSLSADATKTEICGQKINAKFNSIIFEHTTNKYLKCIPWADPEVIGKYTVNYADGSTENIPITYGGNICINSKRHNEPLDGMYYRHTGYVATWEIDGKQTDIGTVYCYEWINPKPDVEITNIVLNPNKDFDKNILIYKMLGIN